MVVLGRMKSPLLGLRTRRKENIFAMLEKAITDESGLSGWKFGSGAEGHSKLEGSRTYFIGIKERCSVRNDNDHRF